MASQTMTETVTTTHTFLSPQKAPSRRKASKTRKAEIKQQQKSQINYFPHLSPYQPPKDGLLSYVPVSVQPYLQVMRLDRPKPSIYFILPHLVGSLQAGIILQSSLKELMRVNLILLLGTFFLRGATCTWNDTVDVEFDRQVERTRHRPLARGAISVTNANIFTAAQALCGLAVLTLLPNACWLYAIPAIAGWFVYPLGKRFTNYPQFVLGLPMAWGVFMGAAAMGAEPLRLELAPYEFVRELANPPMTQAQSVSIICAFVANWMWNLCYETMYSYQDVNDDKKAGVKNVALLLGLENGKAFLAVCAILDILSMFGAGQSIGAGAAFMMGSVTCKTAILAWMIADVKLEQLSSIAWWFRNGGYIAGGAMISGLAAEYCANMIQI